MALSAIVVALTLSDRHARITNRWDRILWFCIFFFDDNLWRVTSVYSPESLWIFNLVFAKWGGNKNWSSPLFYYN